MAWLAGYRRLHRRDERKAERLLAFTSPAPAPSSATAGFNHESWLWHELCDGLTRSDCGCEKVRSGFPGAGRSRS